jgi:hypothetical protein
MSSPSTGLWVEEGQTIVRKAKPVLIIQFFLNVEEIITKKDMNG